MSSKSLNQDLLESYMPRIYLHSKEKVSPVSIDYYISYSYLAVCDKVDRVKHSGCGCKGEWVPVNEKLLIPCGEITLPLKKKWNKPMYLKKYLNYKGPELVPTSANLSQAPVYGLVFEAKSTIDLVYIFNFWYNEPYKLGNMIELGGDHYADIEHVRIRVSKETMNIEKIYYSAHGWDQGAWRKVSEIEFTDNDIETNEAIIYIAKGSHATYHKAGRWWRIFGFANDHTERGMEWQPSEIIDLGNRYDLMSYNGMMASSGVDAIGMRDWEKAPADNIKASMLYRFFYPLSKTLPKHITGIWAKCMA